MTYEQWRITYQNSEQACRALWKEFSEVKQECELISELSSKQDKALAELEKQNAELAAHCELLTKALIDVEAESTSGYYDIPAWLYSDVTEAMNAKPQQSLAKHDADVIKDMLDMLDGALHYECKTEIIEYVDQLRQQAK